MPSTMTMKVTAMKVTDMHVNTINITMLPNEIIECICGQMDSIETIIMFYLALRQKNEPTGQQHAIEYALHKSTLPFDRPELRSLAYFPARQLSQLPEELMLHLISRLKLTYWTASTFLQDHTRSFNIPGHITWSKHMHSEIGHIRENWYIVQCLYKFIIRATQKTPIDNLDYGYTLQNLQDLFFHQNYNSNEKRYFTERRANMLYLKICKHHSVEILVQYLAETQQGLAEYMINPTNDLSILEYVKSSKQAIDIIERAMYEFVQEKRVTKAELKQLFQHYDLKMSFNLICKITFL
jgi:hypothetical protein